MLKLKKIKPMFNMVITTMDVYKEDQIENGVINSTKQKGAIKEYQKVITTGDTVRSVKPGDIVCINPKRYAEVKHKKGSLNDGIVQDNPVIQYNFNTIELDGKECLVLYDQDIHFIVEEMEEIKEEPSTLIHPNKSIII